MTTFDAADKALANAIELIIKETQTIGIPGYAEPAIMTPDQYEPADNPDVPSTLPRDFNRTLAISIAKGLRSFPFRVPVVQRTSLPPPLAGALVVIADATSSTLAFSDGATWIDV